MPVRVIVVASALAVGLLVAGCGNTTVGSPESASGSSTGSAVAAVPGTLGFLYSDSSAVVFMQWPADGSGLVDGTIKVDQVESSLSGQTIHEDTRGFTGQVNGNGGVSFDFVAVSPWNSTVYGALSGPSLTLNLPQQDGELAATSFRAATADQYNSALDTLSADVGQTNTQTQLMQRTSSAENALASDFAELHQDEAALTSDLDGLGQTVSGTGTDTAATRTDAAHVEAEAHDGTDNSTICGDADSTEGDADSVGGDADSVGGDLDGLTSDPSTLRQLVSTVGTDLGAVESDDPGMRAWREHPALMTFGKESQTRTAPSARQSRRPTQISTRRTTTWRRRSARRARPCGPDRAKPVLRRLHRSSTSTDNWFQNEVGSFR
jgi:hypothetical protein